MKESDRGIYREYLGKTLALLGRIFVCRGFSHFGISTRMGESLEPLICFWTVLSECQIFVAHTHTRCSTKQVGSRRMQPGWCSNDLAATSSPLMHYVRGTAPSHDLKVSGW